MMAMPASPVPSNGVVTLHLLPTMCSVVRLATDPSHSVPDPDSPRRLSAASALASGRDPDQSISIRLFRRSADPIG
jgi:hypothetical protein